MSERADGGAADPERRLASTRAVALALAAGPLVALGVVLLLQPPPPLRWPVAPAAIAGIVALAAGHRLHRAGLDRAEARTGAEARMRAFRAAVIAGLAVTEAAALFGVFAYHVSREPFALAGLATHLVLAGALWPTRARLEAVRDGSEDSGPRRGPA